MKKFVFTLEAVARYKETVEKKQKAELARVMSLLKALYDQRDVIFKAIDDTAASLIRALEEGRDIPSEMERHDLYQMFLRDRLEQVQKKIALAEAEKKRIQALLIITMKEIKALERLREEQYAEYLEEVRQDEAKLLGDLISHQATVAEQE